jgi:hypothetical protein
MSIYDLSDGRVYRDRVDENGGLVPVRTYRVPGTVGTIPLGRAERYLPARDRQPDLETLAGS